MAYGVEIVAFVSSVGKIHLPESDNDSDLPSEDYLKLLSTVTREQVDETTVRCPHQETADLMEEVRTVFLLPSLDDVDPPPPAAHYRGQVELGFYRW